MKLRNNLTASGIIFLYCLIYAVLRLSVSSTMELDEAEQFINGSFFSLGYAHQPPFYSWIVFCISGLFGAGIHTLIITKYMIMSLFFLIFFLTARSVWNVKTSLVISGTLLFFHTYSYEFNRDLSHSILVSAMAVSVCYVFTRLLRNGRTSDYLILGAVAGLGILSKYNFAFFMAALGMAALSFREGRVAVLNRRILLSLAVFLAVVSPHLIWLFQNDFMSFRHAMTKAAAGTLRLSTAGKTFRIIASAYSGVLLFLLVFFVIFRPRLSTLRSKAQDSSVLPLFFRYLALYGMLIPLAAIVTLKTGHFSERWLAPLLFSLPPALFSLVELREGSSGFKILGVLSLMIVLAVMGTRALIGFAPDIAGKVERIHTPFSVLSGRLRQGLEAKGIHDFGSMTVIADTEFLAANTAAYFPGASIYTPENSRYNVDKNSGPKLIVWDAKKQGERMPDRFLAAFPEAEPLGISNAPYLRSSKTRPFLLGAALIQQQE